MRVICVGDVMVDVHAKLSGEISLGSDTPAQIALRAGGSAANTAAWLASAGAAVTFVGRVGADPLGRSAIDDLAAAGVDPAVTVDPALATGTCIVLVDACGERTMLPSAGANALGGTIPSLGEGDHLHLSGYALFHEASGAAASAALAAARAARCPVSVDAASAAPLHAYGPRRFLEAVSPALLFANTDEAAVFAGTRDATAAARVLGLRCGEAIVKCGDAGAVWSDGHDVLEATSDPVAAVDSTGAGDAFAAGVLSARLAGADVLTALHAGNALAARAVSRPGARP